MLAYYRSRTRAIRRRDREREAGVQANAYEVCYSSALGERDE